MDGNGRWATKRNLPRNTGHREGLNVMTSIAIACKDAGIPFVSFYAFSTENKYRPKHEVDGLKELINDRFDELAGEFNDNGVKLRVMGDVSYFGKSIESKINNAIQRTKNNQSMVVNVALNYGSRDEISRAAVLSVQRNTPISECLYTYGQPDPDVLIRTGGEKRLSNFMLYQLAYTELFFVDTLWPDFSEKELNAIIQEYYNRDRRFGK